MVRRGIGCCHMMWCFKLQYYNIISDIDMYVESGGEDTSRDDGSQWGGSCGVGERVGVGEQEKK